MPNLPQGRVLRLSYLDNLKIHKIIRHLRTYETYPEDLLRLNFARMSSLTSTRVDLIMKHPIMWVYAIQNILLFNINTGNPHLNSHLNCLIGANTTTSGQYAKAFSNKNFFGRLESQGFYKNEAYIINPSIFSPRTLPEDFDINVVKEAWFDHVEQMALDSNFHTIGYTEPEASAVIRKAIDSIPPFLL